MTTLQMLEKRWEFQKNPPDPLAESLPEGLRAFYREADGGFGRMPVEEGKDAPVLLLYDSRQRREGKNQFLEEAPALYEAMCLELGRSVEQWEMDAFQRYSQDLLLLGECGNPDWPDWLFCKGDRYFTVNNCDLDFPFTGWTEEDSPWAAAGDFEKFISGVLWYYETEALD